jgi:hypothetical protein
LETVQPDQEEFKERKEPKVLLEIQLLVIKESTEIADLKD